ncbi:hypothetical protein, partial [Thiolapillus sp.]|uniref:hypothetical protein n=1 Tax=Thiolapillus sp. TaxID=2017437 RepID=UPI00260068E5
SAIKSGLPMPFTSISAGWIFTLMGLLDDGRPLNQGKSQNFERDNGLAGCGQFTGAGGSGGRDASQRLHSFYRL